MSFSFSIPSKTQPNRLKKQPTSFAVAVDDQSTANSSSSATSTKNYVKEFNPDEVPPASDSSVKPITPIPNSWKPITKLKNLPNLPSISQPDGTDSALQFELDPGFNQEAADNSMGYGLNLRQVADNGGILEPGEHESKSDLELRKFKEDLKKMPEDTGMDEYEDVPVEGFGAALMAGYGWKEGMGIGRNAKEDVKVFEITKRAGRGGLGFSVELSENPIKSNVKAVENDTNRNETRDKRGDEGTGREELWFSGELSENQTERIDGKDVDNDRNGHARRDKRGYEKEKQLFDIGKEVRIVSGKEIGMKGRITEVRRNKDALVLKLSRTGKKLELQLKNVAELGSAEEEKCLRRLKEARRKEEKDDVGKRDRNSSRTSKEDARIVAERVNWLRNHIRVRIISKELNGGRLFLKKGVVVDVIGPGMCDVSMDESRELIQGVEQESLETALPKRGGPVLVLSGRYKGVYGSLLERDSEKETGLVRDADTHEMLNVSLEQIAEYTGNPSDLGY